MLQKFAYRLALYNKRHMLVDQCFSPIPNVKLQLAAVTNYYVYNALHVLISLPMELLW